MQHFTKYVGLDVSKNTIAVAIADEGREPARFWGTIPHKPEAITKLMKQLGTPEQLQVCYEAGPTGYGLQRQLRKLGIACTVIAPSLIPQKPGVRVKTDRRDALKLAQLFRAGELTGIHVPTEEEEALRDLVRAREDVKEDRQRARHRLTKFLLRHGYHAPQGMKPWGTKHRAWLDAIHLESAALRIVFQEYLHQLDELTERLKRLEAEIHRQAHESTLAPVIQALQTLRGVAEITATTIAAEVGCFGRFKPKGFMGFTGLVPSEKSTGDSRSQGEVTKTGNRHLRRVLVEAAWCYRYKPAVKGALRKRQEGQSGQIQAISWKAQQRLHQKYQRLTARGKPGGKVVTAIARELSGFVWAIACQIEQEQAG